MKIINRSDFLALPAGTVFMKFPSQPKDNSHLNLAIEETILIKGATIGEDFCSQGLFPFFEGVNDASEWVATIVDMLKGANSPPLDYDCDGRDGLFDYNQLFLIWNKDDLERLIHRLKQALNEGYTTKEGKE